MSTHAAASVIVLTRNEAANIEACARAVLAQAREGDELLVLDAASTDSTVELAARLAREDPRVRVVSSRETLGFGAARNLGVSLARHEVIVFLSADAVPEPGWLDALVGALDRAEVAYGHQAHAPRRQGVATVTRGLRYRHFESRRRRLPEAYASNVNAAYRREAIEPIGFDASAAGAEDVAFARLARLAGLRLAYAPRARVLHSDSATLLSEVRKLAREGAARAQLRAVLGPPRAHLAWALAAGALALAALAWPLALAPAAAALYAPTLRRAASPVARRYHPAALALAVLASPALDLVFVGSYLVARSRRRMRVP